jgi:hypothetical protein
MDAPDTLFPVVFRYVHRLIVYHLHSTLCQGYGRTRSLPVLQVCTLTYCISLAFMPGLWAHAIFPDCIYTHHQRQSINPTVLQWGTIIVLRYHPQRSGRGVFLKIVLSFHPQSDPLLLHGKSYWLVPLVLHFLLELPTSCRGVKIPPFYHPQGSLPPLYRRSSADT